MVHETQPLMSAATDDIPKGLSAPTSVKPRSANAPTAPWASALVSARDAGRYIPQAIAHRGYKASWPENSMGAFRGAVTVGAHAVETDLHLSADGVVVLSHDASLKRCFGVDKKINECSWEYLSTLKTLREPHEPMARLKDLLEFLAQPEQEKIWLMLDIKADDPPEDMIGAIAKTIAAVSPSVPWEQRICLGCWTATFLETSQRLLPTFPKALITFSLTYARHFLSIPNLGISIFQKLLHGPLGARFLRDCRRADTPVYVWTVNDERNMEWCLRRSARGERVLDGVITDDPKLYLEVCRRWEDELDGKVVPRSRRGAVRWAKDTARMSAELVMLNTLVTVFYVIARLGFFRIALDLPKTGRTGKAAKAM